EGLFTGITVVFGVVVTTVLEAFCAAVLEGFVVIGLLEVCETALVALSGADLYNACEPAGSTGLADLFCVSVVAAPIAGFVEMPMASGERSVFTFRNPTIK